MKIRNKIFVLTLMLLGVLKFGLLNVNAAPSSITMKSKSSMYYFTEKKGTDYISGYNFYRKELTNGTLAYCVSNIDKDVPGGKTLKSKGAITDKGLDYIIKNGYPHKSFTGDSKKDYYITQSAIWEYFDQTKGSNNWRSTSFTSSSTGMKKYVYTLVQGAKSASTQKPSISLSTDNKKMNLSSDGKYFVSSVINVKMVSTKDTFTVNIDSAPKGTFIQSVNGTKQTTFAKGEGFVVYVPVSSVADGTGEVTVSVSAYGVAQKTYYYAASCSKYQKIAPVTIYDEVTAKITAKIILNFEKEKEPTKIKISKQDITTKEELPGATLTIKDKNGKVVESWVSTNEPHYVENLKEGTYTLTETKAPAGYVLSTEKITFKVQKDGKVKSVVMYNAKEKELTKIKISKQDITTKEELPGATLTIKDKNGKVVESWVSTDEPHYVENLKEGTYTLTETKAPAGYVLSTEKITFKVQKDGKVKSVVMYNAKEKELTKVKISKQDITTKEELPGATLTIKDKNGKVVESWVSTDEPHYVENLKEGTYTLTETKAPEGYVLSTEKITFKVQKDGKIISLVMYNTKEAKPVVTKVKISKQDITTKEELPGATLVVKDKQGNVVETWVSTDEPHYIEGLKAGEYTLTETIAPEGYILSNETISFVVKSNGDITSVVMYNAKESKVTKVKISKQDITTKEELPGATLTITDEDGNVVAKWVSENEPHYIEGLKPGTYTLTEIGAPEGYKLSSEEIEFTVNDDGSITCVVMYNARYTEVPITDLNVSTSMIIGATLLILMGTGMVFYAKRSF